MKVVAFLPVKGTSSRIESKNIKLLDGIPLFLHTLDKLMKIKCIDEVYLDTECEDVIALASEYSCNILHRDPALANNKTDGNKLFMNEVRQVEADMYNILDENYYKKAWDIIIKENPDARPVIFSMDLEWCKENLSFLPNPIVISCKNVPMHEDIILMSECTHNIVANSSFSWWGAFLNDYDEKIVVAPKKYFKAGYKSPETFFLDEWRRV